MSSQPRRRSARTSSSVLVDEPRVASNVVWHEPSVTREGRANRGMTVWLTGLSGAGKSSVGAELERLIVASGRPAYMLDGDNLRCGINAGLGFSPEDRAENVRRTGEVAKLFADAGVIAIVCLISPFRRDRDMVRRSHADGGLRFVEVHVATPLDVCAARDPKGLYAKALRGEISEFTGVDSPYEPPSHPDVVLRPSDGDAGAQAARLLEWLDR